MWRRAGLRKAVISYLGAVAFLTEVQALDHVHVARQASSTSSAGTITPTPVLSFIDNLLAVECEPVNIEWFYSGPAEAITLAATNIGVSQSQVPPAIASSSLAAVATPAAIVPVAVQIANVNPTQSSFTWSKVNVLPGWYIINATMPSRNIWTTSNPFYVYAGIDTSCLASTGPSGTSGFPTSSPTASIQPLPAPIGATSSNSTMIGAIVGSCLGAVAVVAGIFLIWLFYRKRRLAKANGSNNYPNDSHRFNGLSSFDSRNALGGAGSTKSRHRHHTSSFGTSVMMNGSEEGIGAEKDSIRSKMDSPGPFGDHAVALASLPVLPSQRSGRTYSAASSIANGFSPVDSPRHPPASNRESLDSTTYPPTSPNTTFRNSSQHNLANHVSTPSHSTTSHHLDTSTTSQSETPSNATNVKKANRQSFGRKRKPAPVYEGTGEEFPISPASPSSPAPAVLYSPSSPSPSPIPDVFSGSPSSSNIGHYATRNRSMQELKPELAHKNSFGPGTQQMHYLIPDMPMSQK